MKIDFLILAGGGNPDWTEKEFSAEHKNLIDICGKPSISYVLDAIKNSKNEGSIILLGLPFLRKQAFLIGWISLLRLNLPNHWLKMLELVKKQQQEILLS